MTDFITAMALFGLAHSLPPLPPVRRRITGAVGERGYLALYSALSVATLWWVVMAYRAAPYVELWWMPAEWRIAAMILMAPVVLLLVLGFATPDPDRLGVHAITRQPLMTALVLWAVIHIVGNGDVAAVVLFAGFGLLALPGGRNAQRRQRARLGEADWRRFRDRTSVLPFAAMIAGRARFRPSDIPPARTVVAVTVYAALLLLHGPVIGIDLINMP